MTNDEINIILYWTRSYHSFRVLTDLALELERVERLAADKKNGTQVHIMHDKVNDAGYRSFGVKEDAKRKLKIFLLDSAKRDDVYGEARVGVIDGMPLVNELYEMIEKDFDYIYNADETVQVTNFLKVLGMETDLLMERRKPTSAGTLGLLRKAL